MLYFSYLKNLVGQLAKTISGHGRKTFIFIQKPLSWKGASPAQLRFAAAVMMVTLVQFLLLTLVIVKMM